ncbi:PIN domain-containing protein [Actinomadura sp. HBU206391]|uniref:PIN domain-containing protein n=1 Tax=Actinomadura sp. HBU206391 TaxID=2731692 RepID=UPI00164F9097|nr:PIN domain-containing protein [Actinomadura sp. HBU206391]MBC6461457.1 hypothetical protein [Actinomadura sp. HBU206391]
MLLRLLPGATPASVLEPLQRTRTDVGNLSTGHFGGPVDRREAYLHWANESVRALRSALPSAEQNRLIMTSAFWHIQSMATPLANATTSTINTEVQARKTELDALYIALQDQISRWESVRIAIPDTSMFIRHDKVEEWDLAPLLQLAEGEPLHIVIPMAVVDELDRLKEASKKETRWRARYSTAVLDRVLPDPTQTGVLREQGYEPGRGCVTVEVLLDPPGHVRLPGDDDEIVDQAYSVNGLATQPVTVLTYDTGQSMRARARTLSCKKLPDPPHGEEPNSN